jgi:hypothetical protein
VERPADRSEHGVFAGGRDQRDAEWRAAGMHRRRHRERGEVEQVDEIGVGAKPAVELDRVGQHLLDRVGGGNGRHREHVDLAEGAVAGAP